MAPCRRQRPQVRGPFTPGNPSYRPRAVWKVDAECRQNLESLAEALNRYWKDNGRKPAALCMLYPKYISDWNAFSCPYLRTSRGGRIYEYAPRGVTSDQTFQILCETHFLLIDRDEVLHRVVR